MTDEELKQEAEEYALDKALYCCSEYGDLKEAFIDGAEYGYNKGFDFGFRKAMTISNEIEQAWQSKNEQWHYPSKGEYPKKGHFVIGYYYGKDNWHKVMLRNDNQWWGEGTLCQQPYAWKEIVLPKEEEK